MDHMSQPFLRKTSETGSSTLMASSLHAIQDSRWRLEGEASQRPNPSSCVSGAGTRRLLQKRRNANLHSYAQTAKRRKPSLGVGLYARTATLAKRHQLFGAVPLCFKGAFEQA